MTYPPPPGNQPDPYQQPGPPVSGQPASGQPSSGQPDPYAQYGQSYPPYSGAPYSGQQPYDPTQQQYAAGQQYPAAQPYGPGQPYGYQPTRSTNTMAILSLVFAFIFAPAGIVLGHIAKRQIAQSGEEGGGLATAGLICSYVFTGFYVLACCGIIGLGWLGNNVADNTNTGY
jgi:hypothetical protein